MKIGVVTNLFPPEVMGGYEIGCGQVVEGLRERGMDIRVLTSTLVPKMGREHVHPILECSIFECLRDMPAGRKVAWMIRRERLNIRAMGKFLTLEQPDVLYFWNSSHLSRCLLRMVRRRGIRCGLFAFDLELLSPEADAWTSQSAAVPGKLARTVQRMVLNVAGPLIGRPSGSELEFDFVHHPTQFLKNRLQVSGVRAKEWVPVRWGVDVDAFHPGAGAHPHSILFTGQVTEHKGVHLLIEALGILKQRSVGLDAVVTIAGQCRNPAYGDRLRALVEKYGLGGQVTFAGFVGRDDLPDLYRRHAIYVFPSIWEEPMGIGILEAMASGLAVISSGTGGSGELFEDGRSGLIFQSGNARDLAQKLIVLLVNTYDSAKIGQCANSFCIERHSFSNCLDILNGSIVAL
jgi:glycogen(starch) synthase